MCSWATRHGLVCALGVCRRALPPWGRRSPSWPVALVENRVENAINPSGWVLELSHALPDVHGEEEPGVAVLSCLSAWRAPKLPQLERLRGILRQPRALVGLPDGGLKVKPRVCELKPELKTPGWSCLIQFRRFDSCSPQVCALAPHCCRRSGPAWAGNPGRGKHDGA